MASCTPGPVEAAVRLHPQANGLVIIISNDYCGTSLDPLTGTHKDGERMKKTFESIGFAAVHQCNVTLTQLQQVTYEATQVVKYPESYKSICFVFSGHGGCDMDKDGRVVLSYLYDQNASKMKIDTIMSQFMPKAAPRIGNIPKLFFIDACRGEKEMHSEAVVVPKSGPGSSGAVHDSKGGTVKVHLSVPSEGNYLVAYSTTEKYQSYEVKHKGGIWLRALSDMIREKAATESITNILTDVNAVLLQKYQDTGYMKAMTQPDFSCKLQHTLYLVPNARSTCAVATESPAHNLQGSSSQKGISTQAVPTSYPPDIAVQYQTMLSEFARTNCIGQPHYETKSFFAEDHCQFYFKSSVTLYLHNGDIIREDSQKFYITQQHSEEEAAKNACEVIAQRQMHHQQQQAQHQYNGVNQQWPQVHNPLPACSVSTAAQQVYPQPQPAATGPLVQQSYNRPTYGASVAPQPSPWQQNPQSQVSGKGPPPSGSDRERLNYFFQTHKITPGFDYVSDNTGSQPRYRCTIKYFMNGKTERVDSGGYFNSKAEAKEIASKKVLNKEAKGGAFELVSRGKNTTPQEKLWKSKLKEFYDKRGQPNAIPNYKTFEVALGKFQSTVFTGDFHSGVKGDVCDSKKEAEQNAAQKAVTLLNQSVSEE